MKIITLLICLLLITGCGKSETKNDNINLSTNEIVDKIYNGIEEENLPKLGNIEITKENMETYLGIDNLDIKEGIASEPMISSIAWSVVVIKVNDNVDINKTKSEIKNRVNPAKWICADAEQVLVESKGNTIILIMMDEENEEIGNKIAENFKNL